MKSRHRHAVEPWPCVDVHVCLLSTRVGALALTPLPCLTLVSCKMLAAGVLKKREPSQDKFARAMYELRWVSLRSTALHQAQARDGQHVGCAAKVLFDRAFLRCLKERLAVTHARVVEREDAIGERVG